MVEKKDKRKCIAAVKVRGSISAQREAKETLKMLHLNKKNNTVLIDNRPSFLGMLQRVQSYATWGEPSKEILSLLIKKRGKLGGKKITDEYAQKVGYESLAKLAEAIFDCKIEHWNLPNIQPVFKLPPPTKGFKGKIKRSFRAGGEAGYRGEKINELLKRMI